MLRKGSFLIEGVDVRNSHCKKFLLFAHDL